jgi:hypothetical protein
MSPSASSRLAAALIAFSLFTVHAQQSNLTYLDFTPSGAVPDGQGNTLVVGS